MNSTEIGRKAEEKAAEHLQKNGYKILQMNWRVAAAEIDIVAQKSDCVYLIEVKFRSSAKQGTGLDYVHASKLHQMNRAAELWVQKTNWNGAYSLLAISVNSTFSVEDVIEIYR